MSKKLRCWRTSAESKSDVCKKAPKNIHPFIEPFHCTYQRPCAHDDKSMYHYSESIMSHVGHGGISTSKFIFLFSPSLLSSLLVESTGAFKGASYWRYQFLVAALHAPKLALLNPLRQSESWAMFHSLIRELDHLSLRILLCPSCEPYIGALAVIWIVIAVVGHEVSHSYSCKVDCCNLTWYQVRRKLSSENHSQRSANPTSPVRM